MKRIAFYGGSFDPPHNGHLAIARRLLELLALDEFVFIPAFHAPHKTRKPTSAFHRFAMLSLAARNVPKIKISTVELDAPAKRFTVETQTKLKNELPDAQLFFVIGADSWDEITTWREWQSVLTQTNIVVVTRPHFEIEFAHVTDKIRERIIDLRSREWTVENREPESKIQNPKSKIQNIFITDAVFLDVSATEIRRKIRADEEDWRELVPVEVVKYIEKYQLYI